MATPMRHVGRMVNTDQRIAVIFMQIPSREDHALVVAIDSLPPRFESALMAVLTSPEAQNDETLGNVLNRRMMPDTQQTLLQTLHDSRLLHPVPVETVVMAPLPNMLIPLRKVLEELGRLPKAATTESQTTKFNPHTQNQHAAVSENASGVAQNLLIEAEMLERDAKLKREKAFEYAPHLRATYEATRAQKQVVQVVENAPAQKVTKRRAAAVSTMKKDKVPSPKKAKAVVSESEA